jgi:hypothetical protein
MPDTGSHQTFGAPAANASDAKDNNAGGGYFLH